MHLTKTTSRRVIAGMLVVAVLLLGREIVGLYNELGGLEEARIELLDIEAEGLKSAKEANERNVSDNEANYRAGLYDTSTHDISDVIAERPVLVTEEEATSNSFLPSDTSVDQLADVVDVVPVSPKSSEPIDPSLVRFKNTDWGWSRVQVIDAEVRLPSNISSPDILGYGPNNVVGLQAKTYYYFTHGQLYQAGYIFQISPLGTQARLVEEFNRIAGLYEVKYGKPDSDVINRANEKYSSLELSQAVYLGRASLIKEWNLDGVMIRVSAGAEDNNGIPLLKIMYYDPNLLIPARNEQDTLVQATKSKVGQSVRFKGADWGWSKQQVKEKNIGETVYNENDGETVFFPVRIAGLQAHEYYSFHDNKLYNAGYTFNVDSRNVDEYVKDYTRLAILLEKKYGPAQGGGEEWSDPMGKHLYESGHRGLGFFIKIGHVSLKKWWNFSDTEILLLLNAEKGTRSFMLVYRNPEILSQHQADVADEYLDDL